MAGNTNEKLAKFNVEKDYKEKTDAQLNMVQYFPNGEWEATSPYEQRRLSNLARNFYFMSFMGWVDDSAMPWFMKTKRQRAAEARAADKAEEMEKDPDKEWKPRKPATKKKFDPYQEEPGPSRLKPASKRPPREPPVDGSGDGNQIQAVKIMKAKIVGDNKPRKRKAPEPTRRSERNKDKPRVNYDIPGEDRFIWCCECDAEVLDTCEEHPMTDVTDATPEGRRSATYAERTVPQNLEVRDSGIPNAGRGVFAKTTVRKSTRFGPYVGEERDVDSDAKDSGYAWAIYDDKDNLLHYCDARDPSWSNWMRFVNCANSESEQNLEAFQYRGQIFYKACRPIKSGDELLTYYGDEYAVDLGLLTADGAQVHPPQPEPAAAAAGEEDVIEEEDVAEEEEEMSESSESEESEDEFSPGTDSDVTSTSDDEFAVPTKPPPKKRRTLTTYIPPTASTLPTASTPPTTSTLPVDLCPPSTGNGQRERTYYPLSGNTTVLTEVPDINQHFNSDSGRYSCPCCVYKIGDYIQVNILIQHIIRDHMEIDPPIFRGLMIGFYQHHSQYKLKVSGLSSTEEIRSRVLSGPDNRTCGLCGKTFGKARQLEQHILVHTGDRPFTCNICGKGFTQAGHLERHQIIHSAQKPFTCGECGKGFNDLSTMLRHERTIHGDQRFTCEVCHKQFTRKGNLNRHMRIHTGEKPYVCQVCGHGFTELGTLKCHMRVHTGDKPYQCDYCHMAFARSTHRNGHMRTIHGHKKCEK